MDIFVVGEAPDVFGFCFFFGVVFGFLVVVVVVVVVLYWMQASIFSIRE